MLSPFVPFSWGTTIGGTLFHLRTQKMGGEIFPRFGGGQEKNPTKNEMCTWSLYMYKYVLYLRTRKVVSFALKLQTTAKKEYIVVI